jgi:hypothetical protein
MAERAKFATQLDPALLGNVRTLAQTEGRHIQSLIEEALQDLLEKRRAAKARPHVLLQHQKGIKAFDVLYDRLAR